MFTVQLVDISTDRKLTILCWKLCLGYALNEYFMLFLYCTSFSMVDILRP